MDTLSTDVDVIVFQMLDVRGCGIYYACSITLPPARTRLVCPGAVCRWPLAAELFDGRQQYVSCTAQS